MEKYIWIYFCLFSTTALFASALSKTEPYLVPKTQGCWPKCGGPGSCPTACGKGGFCCRKGKTTCPKSLADLNTYDGVYACIRDPTGTFTATTVDPTGAYLVPNSQGCWPKCGGPGSCPTACGKGGYCCKKGRSNCPKYLADLNTYAGYACIRHPTGTAITTTIAPTGPYLVPGTKGCWPKCGGPGSCPSFCGKGGFCCMKGKSTCPKSLADLNTYDGFYACIRDPTGTFTAATVAPTGKEEFTTCKRQYTKKGCYRQSLIGNERLLISDRDFKGIELDWANFGKSIHSLACRCSDTARSNGYKFFSLRFWAECWGKNVTTVQTMKLNDVTLKRTKCANKDFTVCDDKDPFECIGKAWHDYLYHI